MPICGQSITSLNLSQGSIDCQFNANALPINVNALRQSVANPKTEYHKGKVLNFFQSPQSMSIGIVYNVGELADFHRIGRLEKIGGDWLSPPMQCQCNANPGRIRCQSRAHFGLATSRQSMVHRGQSCAIPIPIRYQSRLRPKHCMLPIQYQSATNQLPIRCQCQAASQCSAVNPLPTHRQSSANPSSIDVDPVPI